MSNIIVYLCTSKWSRTRCSVHMEWLDALVLGETYITYKMFLTDRSNNLEWGFSDSMHACLLACMRWLVSSTIAVHSNEDSAKHLCFRGMALSHK